MKKIPRSQQTREEIKKTLNEGTNIGDPKSSLIRLAARAIVEEALEATVRDLLGREYYERRDDGEKGHRNGYRTDSLKTGEGEIEFSVPQVRGVENTLIKKLKENLSGRTEQLENLAIEMFARGCSTRDIEDTFRGEDGRSMLTRTAVSEVTEVLWEQYEEFVNRDLSDIDPFYLFLDGIAERLRPGAKREAVLCAWCLTRYGKKVLVHLSPGTKESTDCCKDFLEDLKRRGLQAPILVVTDGAPGLIRAVEECFPYSLRQRCLAHKMRNLMGKLPGELKPEVKEAAKAAYEAPSPAMARILRDDLVERYGKQCPAAVRCFEEDFEACIAHLQCPPNHRKSIRTTNLLERLFVEERRRTKVAPVVFGERPVLKMMYAAVLRASDRWRDIRITELELAQLEHLERKLIKTHKEENRSTVKKSQSTPNHFYSKFRT